MCIRDSVYTTPYPNSLDEVDGERITMRDIDMIRSEDGTHKNFRFVRLQRLANPLIEWDPTTNPYLTIDSMEVDLVSINGAGRTDESITEMADEDHAISLERGDADRTLWGHRREMDIRAGSAAASMNHHYAEAFTESLGRTNDVFDPTNANGIPFAWLTWNNRPFVSHMEIMNVPYLAPDQLTYAPEISTGTTFSIDDMAVMDPYTERRPGSEAEVLAGRYGHLLNFFGADLDSTTNSFADAYRLLDYLEVPSRFVGNESYYLTNSTMNVLRHPFNFIPHYRVPGKININTIPPNGRNLTNSITPTGAAAESLVWEALVSDEYAMSALSWGTFKDSLYGSTPFPASGLPTHFANPFRPADAANLVPGVTTPIPEVECTLLRPGIAAPGRSLFDYDSTEVSINSLRSAAFRNGLRTRLGNMVTTKSSLLSLIHI